MSTFGFERKANPFVSDIALGVEAGSLPEMDGVPKRYS